MDSLRNPQIQELPLYPERTMFWYGLWAGGIIFLENKARQNVTVNSTRYRVMITDYLLPEIEIP